MRNLFLSCLALWTSTVWAQKDYSGLWVGNVQVGVDLQLVFHIQKEGITYNSLMDVPGQGVRSIVVNTTLFKNDSLLIAIEKLHAVYSGRVLNDSTIEGTWNQGKNYSLNLKKVKEIETPKRPQNPVGPFPYTSKDIIYDNQDHSITYGATITIPPGEGPFPSILLLTGSGQQNRDEEILGHRPFAVLADYLTRRGYLVMRVDDRGMGQTTGNVSQATTRDFANDAEVSLGALKKINSVDTLKIGLLGHSEGGMIAQLVAAERHDINFIIFLAGPGEKTTQLMKEQMAAVMRSSGSSKTAIDQYLVLYSNLIDLTIRSASFQQLHADAEAVLDSWIKLNDPSIVLATTGIKDEITKEKFLSELLHAIYSPWFRYFLAYDPDPYLKKIRAKILALDGEKDIQVIAESNLREMKKSLQKGVSKDFTMMQIPGVNHLFQTCKICSVPEYGSLEETVSPAVLKIIAEWLDGHVKFSK